MDRASRTALACLAVVAAALALWRLPALVGSLQDDGFIYFRIANHAAHGLGPVFNVGEHVDAATSPVWVWLLAAGVRMGIPLPMWACGLGLVSALLTVLLAARWCIELAAPRRLPHLVLALTGPLLLAVDARFWLYAMSGMETTLCALVWLAATRSLVRRLLQAQPERHVAGLTLAACLVRPEYVLFVIAIAAVALASRTMDVRRLARTLLPVALGGLAYLGAHWIYFGDPFPNTYYAKRAADWTHVKIGLAYLRGLPATYPILLAAIAALWMRPLRSLALGPLLGLVFYSMHVVSLGGDHFVFYRPYLIVLPMTLCFTGAAAARFGMQRPLPLQVAVMSLALAAVLVTARVRLQPAAFGWVRLAAQLGTRLSTTYPAGTHLGLFAIGATGYTSGLPVVDALGLADRHVARSDLSHEHACALDIGHERGDPEYVLAHADVVVLWGAYAPIRFESLDEVREGFYSQKKFLAAARDAVEQRRWRLRDFEFAPGAHWLLLEKVR